jgi:hypothetical protein
MSWLAHPWLAWLRHVLVAQTPAGELRVKGPPTGFQWAALSVLAAAVATEIYWLLRYPAKRRGGLLRLTLWLAAAAAIYEPELVALISRPLGIGRAADLVMYVFALAFLGTTFYFYARCVRLERQITELARLFAIREAERGGEKEPQRRRDAEEDQKAESK